MKRYTKAQFERSKKLEDIFSLTCLVASAYLVMILVFLKI